MRKNGAKGVPAASIAGIAVLLAAALDPAVQAQPSGGAAEPGQWTTAQDHRDMQSQLGIRALRPGRNADASAPNAANYDEALANPFPVLPDPLVSKSGEKIGSAEAWWSVRRPEIVEDFEREVVGRVPAGVPAVSWSVVATSEWKIAGKRVVGRQLVGIVDNSAYPGLAVEICMTLVTPARAEHVPVMIMFGGGALPTEAIEPDELPAVCRPPGRAGPPPGRPELARGRGGPPPVAGDPPATEQLIAAGWGFASLRPTSVQADNGAGLRSGIIGLVNKGQPRKPDDWGALRAWAWGASRGLDWLETQSAVDAKRVGVEGVSRYGKAALVAMAFDPRFAVVLVGSSGEGGAKLHRRNFGEAVENLTGPGEYHWMAGNFMKYGAAEATFGSMTPGDLPVDAHELIALCAPRPVFVSYGVPEKGDAQWLDHQGSFMATVAAQPVFRLLGAKDLGRSDDYTAEKMPAVNVGLLDGALAWRQHDGGHTDGPNWRYFIPWANAQLRAP
jgi:(4-O-methyl)-D-glucuronate---lignin esterase